MSRSLQHVGEFRIIGQGRHALRIACGRLGRVFFSQIETFNNTGIILAFCSSCLHRRLRVILNRSLRSRSLLIIHHLRPFNVTSLPCRHTRHLVRPHASSKEGEEWCATSCTRGAVVQGDRRIYACMSKARVTVLNFGSLNRTLSLPISLLNTSLGLRVVRPSNVDADAVVLEDLLDDVQKLSAWRRVSIRARRRGLSPKKI
ncbi:hypothetical protein MPH_13249 [Macrophomina phaseolina MS6]|uniref:Uncharacterized protein n=1 Tax=Macrophomina phaseolina (strain MS6) TaxID=1126212 RepID=K2R9Z3_MACPH|nr:hypothetical protein MPH_13249 [Macrophomina phaseolina MS6]